MNSERRLASLLLAGLLAAAGCSPGLDPAGLITDDAAGTLVVDATLIVDDQLPVIRLSRTLPAATPFTWTQAAVSHASVMLIEAGADTLRYEDHESWLGYYLPDDWTVPRVRPETTYELVVETLHHERLTAVTTTPGRMQVESWVLLDDAGETELRTLRTFTELGSGVFEAPENQLVYPEGLLEARFPGTTAAGLGAAGFQLALFSLDENADYVIDPAFFDEEDFEALDRRVSSPVVIAEDQRVRLPWFGVYFQGRHLYRILAVDRNWFDYVRSNGQTDGGLGFGGNAGDTFSSPIFHVQGGIGLFGSASTDEVGFRVLPAP